MLPSDWFGLSTILTPFWVLLGYGLSRTDFRNKKVGWRHAGATATVVVVVIAWWSGAQQSAHDRELQAQNKDTHQIVSAMASDLQVAVSADVPEMLKEIQRRVLPRQIRPKQAAAMKEILQGVSPQRFQISITSNENETLLFARQLAAVLAAAGWTPIRDSGPIWGCTTSYSGVVISGRLAQSRPLVASALGAAINILDVTVNDDHNFNSCAPEGAVEIFVGKP